MSLKLDTQYVCKVCGYNMVGYLPDNCPFCGASKSKFITAKECSEEYYIEEKEVNKKIKRLNSFPKLGLEHSAYQIETENKVIWIDCPSTFRKDVDPMDTILFTHHHFLGASNLYSQYFNAEVWIHGNDAQNSLSKHHTFTHKFEKDFTENGIKAFHIDGHTSGFTFYIFEEVLLDCDYTFYSGETLRFNPYGPGKATRDGGEKMKHNIESFELKKVCGVDYVVDYEEWKPALDSLLEA